MLIQKNFVESAEILLLFVIQTLLYPFLRLLFLASSLQRKSFLEIEGALVHKTSDSLHRPSPECHETCEMIKVAIGS